MQKLLLIFLILIQQSLTCFEELLFSTTDQIIVQEFLQLKNNQEQCFELLIKKGFLSAALEIYEQYFLFNQIELKSKQIIQTLENQKNFLEILSNQIHSAFQKKQLKIYSLSFNGKKAQNKDRVFLQVKFSHRIDSPGCLKYKIDNIKIQSKGLDLQAFCILSNNPIKFILNLEFFNEINQEESFYFQEGVGTFLFNITKKEKQKIWGRLLIESDKRKAPIWWSLREKEPEMDEFFDNIEEEENIKEIKIDSKKKQKRQQELEKKLEQDCNTFSKCSSIFKWLKKKLFSFLF